MAVRRGFTIVELIMSIIIMGILAAGAYISLANLYNKRFKSKAISELSLSSTRLANQISALLYHRVPASVIGYDINSSTFESIYNTTKQYHIMEWIVTDFESYNEKYYSGLADFDRCDKSTNMIYSPDTNISKVLNRDVDTALIFAGSFDQGGVSYDSNEFNNSFGWHQHSYNKIFKINSASKDENITLQTKPDTIYERYFLVDQAFAIARAADINDSCKHSLSTTDDDLLLFYNFKPWKGEDFCNDANATILAKDVSGFSFELVNGNLEFKLTLTRKIHRVGRDINVTISKDKVIF